MPRDEALGDDEWVIRFGIMDPKQTLKSALDAMEDPEVRAYELSFFGDKGLSTEEIALRRGAPNPRMRVSTVGRLREAGFEPYLDEPPENHLALRFSQEPTEEEIETLEQLFDEPEENPHPFM